MNISAITNLTKEKPKIKPTLETKYETYHFAPKNRERGGEGGLRIQGYFDKGYIGRPLVSIITVVYNGDKFLENTIQAIITQTYGNIEFIIIDGGSTDGTLEIIKKYEDKINYWVSEPDKGMYDGLNKGFSLALGDLITFCNSDDVYHDNEVISTIVNIYNKYKFDCCYGTAGFIDDENNILSYKYPLKFRSRYLVTLGLPFVQPTFFWRREILKKTGLFNLKYKIASDYDLIGRILINSNKIHRINMNMVNFRKHGNSFGDNNSTLASKEVDDIKHTFHKNINYNYLMIIYDRIIQKSFNILKQLLLRS